MLPSLFCFHLQYQILKELSLRMILTIPLCVLNSFFRIPVIYLAVLTFFCCFQIFVGGLDPNVTEDVLKQVFAPYGEVIHVKIPVGKRCGFVQFVTRLTLFTHLVRWHVGEYGMLENICRSIFVLTTNNDDAFQTFCRASAANAARDLDWLAECSAFVG